ncbi:MAG TPA: hypothetical protein VHO69_12805, partial [Phototrophicaceae bacterium]|nr:hypothetical protein [Phototrophicaceae bacterium]
DELYQTVFIRPYNALADFLATFDRDAVDGFGRSLARFFGRLGEAVRFTQTGQLNWNVAGIVGGLAIILIIVVIGRAA